MRAATFFGGEPSDKRVWLDGKAIDIYYIKDLQLKKFTLEKVGQFKIIDVRELEEYLAEHIEHADLLPVSVLGEMDSSSYAVTSDLHSIALVHCRSGRRTRNNEEAIVSRLASYGFNEIYFMDGGIENAKLIEKDDRLAFRFYNSAEARTQP